MNSEAKTLAVCSGWARGSKTPHQGLGSRRPGNPSRKDLLCPQLQSHNPMKSPSKIYELVLPSRAAAFKFAQVLPSKHINKAPNASLRTHQASPWREACPVGVHFHNFFIQNMEKVTFYLHFLPCSSCWWSFLVQSQLTDGFLHAKMGVQRYCWDRWHHYFA